MKLARTLWIPAFYRAESCGRKIFNAVELVWFIRSGLERNVDSFKCIEQRKHAFRCQPGNNHTSRFTLRLRVECKNLCGKQTTQLEELIVNPNGRIDSYCRQFYILHALTIPAATQVFIFTFISKAKCPLGNIRGII